MNLIYTLNSAYCESIVIFFNVFKTRRRHVATLSHAAHLKSIDHKLKVDKSKNSEFQVDNIISFFESLFFVSSLPVSASGIGAVTRPASRT